MKKTVRNIIFKNRCFELGNLLKPALFFIGFCLLTHISTFTSVYAQDIHYSQYFNVPLSFNPALTGKTDGSFRAGINYRNQWFGLVNGRSTYSTPSFFGDVPLRFKSKDVLGIGLNIINDRSSGGRFIRFSGMLSVAYHKAMGKSKNHFFSTGLQFGVLQHRLDLAGIRLGDQIVLQDVTLTNVSSDMLDNKAGGFDMQAGFDWSSKFSEKAKINFGYAAAHLSRPGIALAAAGQKLPIRHMANFGAEFGMGKHGKLLPLFVYMTQAKANEIYTGLSFGVDFSRDAAMFIGGYYRVNDALVPYFGLNVKGVRMGVSYDITTSSLNNTNGGIEISLMYVGSYTAVPDVRPSLYCPRF